MTKNVNPNSGKLPQIPFEFFSDYVSVAKEFHFHPRGTLEVQRYAQQLIEQFNMDRAEFKNYLREHFSRDFKCVADPPVWYQGGTWPFSNGLPMLFVGQVRMPADRSLFHDEAMFYVFVDKTGRVETIMQVA